jgi:Mg2+ and Co2+ transporter CorA
LTPSEQWPGGFAFATVLMVTSLVASLAVFKRVGWL